MVTRFIHIVPGLVDGRFTDERNALRALGAADARKGLGADLPLADVLVTIDVRTKRRFESFA